MEVSIRKAYKEVAELLKFFNFEDLRKIPKEEIMRFENNKDNDYEYKVDENKKFFEQEMLPETKIIFANIFRKYWATDYQKDLLNRKEKLQRKIIEDEKRRRFNPDDLFKKKKVNKKEQINEEKSMIEIKDNIIQRFINWFKHILKK